MTSDMGAFQFMELRSWNRFRSPRLVVSPDVVGRSHSFVHDGASIEIELPTAERIEQTEGDTVGSVTSRWAADGKPIKFNIEKVDVVVRLGQKIALPPEVLSLPANAFQVVPDDKQKALDAMAASHGASALAAFEYWLSIVRWVCDDHQVGRREHRSELTDWDVRLHDVHTGKKVWIEPGYASVPATSAVQLDHWLQVESELKKQAIVPTHKSLEFTARHDRDRGDFRKALMDISVSCETYLRASVLRNLPVGLTPSALDQIEKANIAQYVGHLFPDVLAPVELERYRRDFKPELSSLFSLRNDLFHRGASDRVSEGTCDRFLLLAKGLFGLRRIGP